MTNYISTNGNLNNNQQKLPDDTLSILDVGHGNSAVLKDKGSIIVIDTGPKSGLLEFLLEQGISQIDCLILSHADQDHIGGLIALLGAKTVTIKKILLNSDSEKASKIWDSLAYELNKKSYEGTEVIVGLDASKQTMTYGEIEIQIIAPSVYLTMKGVGGLDLKGRRIKSNSLSAVIKLSQRQTPIALFAGDIDDIGLEDLLKNKSASEIQSPILVFPHHGGLAGGKTDMRAFTKRLCTTIHPQRVIFSIGRRRGIKYPRPEIVETIHQIEERIIIGCTQLSMNCSLTTKPNPLTHLYPIYSKGREKNECCTGTIVIDFNNNGKIYPNDNQHQQFITLVTDNPLCRRYMS